MPRTVPLNNAPTSFRYDINALRALAVLAVVAYHFGVYPIGGGFAGVDVFLVMSGFLITSQIQTAHEAGTFSVSRFYLSRLRRIFPALATVCAASLAWGWIYTLPYDYRDFARNALAALFFVSNIAFAGAHGYFDLAASSKPLLHTWSLSVEGQFYLLLPLYLWLLRRFAPQRIVAGLLVAAVLSLAWGLNEADHVRAFYLLPSRAWEFLLGGILGLVRIPTLSKMRANSLAGLGLTSLLTAFVFIDSSGLWPSAWTLVPVLATLVLLAVPNATLLNRVWRFRPIQTLGDLSYSIYLWHWPVLVYARQYAVPSDGHLTLAALLSLAALTLVLSALSWRFIEQPIRQRRKWCTDRLFVWGAGGFALACLVFTAVIVVHHGMPERFPDYVQRAFPAISIDTPRPECLRDTNSHKKDKATFCSFGSGSSAPTMLLWGDSHANQYLSVLSEIAQTKGVTGAVATQAECGPSGPDGIAELEPDSNVTCQRFNEEVRRFIRQTPSLQIMVIGRLWRGADSVANAVTLTRELIAAGKEVILLGPLPLGGFNVPEYWSQLQLHAGHRIDDVVVSLDSQQSRRALWKQTKLGLASEATSGRLIFIDPFESDCDSKQCYLVKDGVLIIRDTTHLSQQGAKLLLPQFTQALVKALRINLGAGALPN